MREGEGEEEGERERERVMRKQVCNLSQVTPNIPTTHHTYAKYVVPLTTFSESYADSKKRVNR